MCRDKNVELRNVIKTAKLMSNTGASIYVISSAPFFMLLFWGASEIFSSSYVFLPVWMCFATIYLFGRKILLKTQVRRYERRLRHDYGYDHRVSIFWANDYFAYSGIVDILKEEKGDGIESLAEASHIKLVEETSREEKYIVLLPIIDRGIVPGIHHVTHKGRFTLIVQPVV